MCDAASDDERGERSPAWSVLVASAALHRHVTERCDELCTRSGCHQW